MCVCVCVCVYVCVCVCGYIHAYYMYVCMPVYGYVHEYVDAWAYICMYMICACTYLRILSVFYTMACKQICCFLNTERKHTCQNVLEGTKGGIVCFKNLINQPLELHCS
jgi:hypothetical protein